jgi:hypothetical protein
LGNGRHDVKPDVRPASASPLDRLGPPYCEPAGRAPWQVPPAVARP